MEYVVIEAKSKSGESRVFIVEDKNHVKHLIQLVDFIQSGPYAKLKSYRVQGSNVIVDYCREYDRKAVGDTFKIVRKHTTSEPSYNPILEVTTEKPLIKGTTEYIGDKFLFVEIAKELYVMIKEDCAVWVNICQWMRREDNPSLYDFHESSFLADFYGTGVRVK